jgi:hypothetical protein
MQVAITDMTIAHHPQTVFLFLAQGCSFFNEPSGLSDALIVVLWLQTHIILETVAHSNPLNRHMLPYVPYLIELLTILSDDTVQQEIFSLVKQLENPLHVLITVLGLLLFGIFYTTCLNDTVEGVLLLEGKHRILVCL